MTRAIETGIAAVAMSAAWIHAAAATEIENPYFHPPSTSATTPSGKVWWEPTYSDGECKVSKMSPGDWYDYFTKMEKPLPRATWD